MLGFLIFILVVFSILGMQLFAREMLEVFDLFIYFASSWALCMNVFRDRMGSESFSTAFFALLCGLGWRGPRSEF